MFQSHRGTDAGSVAQRVGLSLQHYGLGGSGRILFVLLLAGNGTVGRSYEKNEKGYLRFDPDTAQKEYRLHEASKSKKSAVRLDDDYDDLFDDSGVKGAVAKLNYQRAKEEVRIKRATADVKELQRDEMLGIYHRAEFVEDWVTELILAQRSAMAALPGKLAPILAGETDESVIAARIKAEVRAIQEDLSQYEYNPGYYRERLAESQGKTITDDE